MANLGLIDFKIGLYIKGNVTAGQNKFEVHMSISTNLATWTLFGHNLVIFHLILTLFFSKCLFFKDKSNGDNN